MELPLFYIQKMKELLKYEFEDYIKTFENKAYSGIRVNTLKISPEEFKNISSFNIKGVSWCKEGFYCDEEEKPSKSYLYSAGLYYIQEPSAMSAAEILPVKENDAVIDLCAAPGGKTTQIAAKLNGTGILFSNDISATRAKAIVKNIELFGVKNCVVLSDSPQKIAARFEGYFDCVLVDAPCGGEGMFRKNKDIIKNYNESMLDICKKSQKDILNSAAKLLKNGGHIVYSTCTFSPDEDEKVINDFLIDNDNFDIISIDKKYGFDSGKPDWVKNGDKRLTKCARIWPHKMKGEGHFIALLNKKGIADEMIYETEKNSDEKFLKPVKDFVKSNLNVDLNGIYKIINDMVYIIPPKMPKTDGFRVLRSGLLAGNIKRNGFEPSQALAMALKKEEVVNFADFDKNDERVKRYLKGETVEFESIKNGWVLVCVEGFSLGWAKAQNGRLKNKYAIGWRWS